MESMSSSVDQVTRRGAFSSRKVFILAAIGSAVGLGNIWRFPYVAYENGGGAFLIPYLIALLTAGIPFLLMDYAIGHKHRGSAPLSFARMRRGTEFLGWWQVGICFLIAVYYAAVIAWALRYMLFSLNEAWGDDPEGFFVTEFLETGEPGVSLEVVLGVLTPLVIVWLAVLVIMALGVEKGVGRLSLYFIPILIVAFAILVGRAVTLDGATDGLDAFFSPNWEALTEPGVWAAAYGQIFFSLSIGFGIMITYASYVDRRSDMPGAGLVVGFANSGFELLAGIGVFAALGFMAQASGVAVDEVVEGGIGLAFIVFPALISQAPAGALIGVLFFGSLVIAGMTSLVSVIEVVVSAVRDKFEMTRLSASMAVGVPAALMSLVLFSTTSGLHVLDIVDHFINQYGILLVAVVSMLVVAWALRSLPVLADHLNHNGSLKLGKVWFALIAVVAPLVLGYILVDALVTDIKTPYGGFPAWMLAVFGWGGAVSVVAFGLVASLVRWRAGTPLQEPYERIEEDVR